MTISRQLAFPTTPDRNNAPAPVFPSADYSNGANVGSKASDAASKSASTTPTTAPMAALQKGNTRRIGQRLTIDLKKKPPPDGFGFTLTSRDYEFSSETGSGEALVYVKTISPNGAAVEDGRLRAGDRLLEVNGKKLDKNFGQPDVVQLLRQVKPGETTTFVVSRQTTVTASEHHQEAEKGEKRVSPALPRPLKEETENDVHVEASGSGKRSYDQMLLTFDIPLNDTGQ